MGNEIPFVTNTIGPVTFGFLVGMLPIDGLLRQPGAQRATPEEKPGLAALIPVYVAGGAFFMVLHLSGGLMTVFAEHNTDRRAEWIPAATEFYAQKAMPSYFSNAGPDLPRPDERTLFTVPDAGRGHVRRPDPQRDRRGDDFRADPPCGVTVHDYTGQAEPGGRPSPARSIPTPTWIITEAKDAHGVATTTVKVEPEQTTAQLGEVAMTRNIDGARGSGGPGLRGHLRRGLRSGPRPMRRAWPPATTCAWSTPR